MKNVAIFMPHRIGEFVLALSVVMRKVTAGDEAVTLIVPQHLIPLCTLLTQLPYFPARRGSRAEVIESIAGVKRQGFEKLYMLTNSFSTGWFALWTGIPVRRGLRSEIVNPFLTHTVQSAGNRSADHLTREYAAVLEIAPEEPGAWEGIAIKGTAAYTGKIALCPGAGHGVAGKWEGFREIVKLLPSYHFVVLGSEQDVAVAKNIASHFPHRVENRAGKTSIEAAASILSSVSVVIANHSGLMQLAGFLGTPVVGIFGPTSASRYRPLGAAVRCATADGTCTRCHRNSCMRKDTACLTAITPEQVIAFAGEIVRSAA